MKILFIFASFPEKMSEGVFPAIVKEFYKNGHEVYVSAKNNINCPTGIYENEGIEVLRVKAPNFTGVQNNIKKALAYQIYTFKQLQAIKRFFNKIAFDLIISHSLPPELAFEIRYLKKAFKCPFLLIQTDFTWQDAVAYGFFSKNSLVAKYYRFWEKTLFKLADFVGCLSEGYINYILNLYPKEDRNKYFVLELCSTPTNIEKKTDIRNEYGYKGKFLAIYGGSVGPAQNLYHLLDLADSIQDYEDIKILILGKGSKIKKLEEDSKKRNLKNIDFLEYLPKKDYLELLASCDAGFIVLNEKHATPNIPSKILNYFELGIPVLAAIDKVTDLGILLDKTGTGLWCYSGDVKQFKNNLLNLYNSPKLRSTIAENQKKYYSTHNMPEHAYFTVMNKLNL